MALKTVRRPAPKTTTQSNNKRLTAKGIALAGALIWIAYAAHLALQVLENQDMESGLCVLVWMAIGYLADMVLTKLARRWGLK